MNQNKIKFWAVFSLVTGSQLGAGIFMLPTSIAPYGLYGLIGWIISGTGAIFLSLVFSMLCYRFPKTGGPHVYVHAAFGNLAAFFIGWTYWIISWISTTAVIITAVNVLNPFFNGLNTQYYCILELILLFGITILNLKGVKAAGIVEIFLIFLKFIPLIFIPFSALYFFNINNIFTKESLLILPTSTVLGQVSLITLWGFIGIESATTTAENVINPSKTIPKAIIIGTTAVALLYIINSIGIMGLIPSNELSELKAPYINAVQIMFSGNWHFLVSIITSLICIGTLNAWILTSGQIVLGLSQDGFMPKFLSKKNKKDAPYMGIVFSSLGIIPLLLAISQTNIAKQINAIIDFSVIAFLFVYLACVLSLIRILLREDRKKYFLIQLLISLMALFYSLWILYETSLKSICIASLFIVSGFPLYFFWYRKNIK